MSIGTNINNKTFGLSLAGERFVAKHALEMLPLSLKKGPVESRPGPLSALPLPKRTDHITSQV